MINILLFIYTKCGLLPHRTTQKPFFYLYLRLCGFMILFMLTKWRQNHSMRWLNLWF